MSHSTISAGVAVEIGDDFYDLDINEFVTGGRDGFIAYEVNGDSGSDRIPHGSIIFVDTQASPHEGQPIAVSINGRVCVKLFSHTHRGLYLVSANSEYKSVEVGPNDNFRILGIVTSHLAVHKR